MPTSLNDTLNAEKALIFRITHRDNIPWLLRNGLHCSNSEIQDPDYVPIGSAELIGKRQKRDVPVPPGGVLSDYLPFYFTPFSPMLYNIKTGFAGVSRRKNEEIVILAVSLRQIEADGIDFVFTDRHAYLTSAQFTSDLENLDMIDWDLLRQRDFQRDRNDPGKFDRYQAEALIHRYLPASALVGVACYNQTVRGTVEKQAAARGLNVPVAKLPSWYF